MKLAPQYPEASLHGFDISTSLFHPLHVRPATVKLETMDCKQPPPVSEQGKYDVVHARLLAAAMSPPDWGLTVRNLMLLLKPGGALQWEECNFAGVQHLRGRSDSTVYAARRIGRLFRDALHEKFSYGWSTLPTEMTKAGLIDVEEDIVSSDRATDTREALTSNGMSAMFGWARLMSKSNSPGALSTSELEVLELQAFEDIRSGCYVRFDIHVALGFKPK